MKLLTGLFALAYAQHRPETPSGFGQAQAMVTESDFQLVPEGYEGSFQGFNVTYMIENNSKDGIFREFEALYQTVESGLGRTNYNEEQKMSIRKVT